MVVGSCVVTLRASWVNSLKEKRMEVKKIIEKTKNRFNLAVAEVGENDSHRTIKIGFACVSNDRAVVDSVIERAVNFIENITDAEIIDVYSEIF